MQHFSRYYEVLKKLNQTIRGHDSLHLASVCHVEVWTEFDIYVKDPKLYKYTVYSHYGCNYRANLRGCRHRVEINGTEVYFGEYTSKNSLELSDTVKQQKITELDLSQFEDQTLTIRITLIETGGHWKRDLILDAHSIKRE